MQRAAVGVGSRREVPPPPAPRPECVSAGLRRVRDPAAAASQEYSWENKRGARRRGAQARDVRVLYLAGEVR